MRTFEEGANHTKVYKDGFSRQSTDGTTTLMKKIVEKIEKQTGVKLL